MTEFHARSTSWGFLGYEPQHRKPGKQNNSLWIVRVVRATNSILRGIAIRPHDQPSYMWSEFRISEVQKDRLLQIISITSAEPAV